MKLKINIIILIMLLAITMPISAEYVFLKDGAIVEGTIISDAAGSVVIRDKDKKIRQIPRTNIMRILYTELYMGKVYVQKTDGKNVICYMVDEDRESYTFRKELYNPEEFKLKRDQVLFMARGNPTGLEGEAYTDRVDLKWFPPYNPVKRYRIYIKGPGDKKFILADESRSKSSTINDLKSNTKYQFHVTAVDDAGDESIPSNEFAVTTKNIKPEKPDNISLTKNYSSDRKTYTAELKWNPSADSDGTVKGYNIYRDDIGMDKPTGKSSAPAYSANNLIAEMDYFFTVKAVDDMNEESEEGAFISTRERPFVLVEVKTGYFMPQGRLGEMLKNGYGITLSLYKTDLLLRNIEAGFSAGYRMFEGNDDTTDSSYMIPITANLRYRFPIIQDVALVPEISGGYFYNSIDYMKLNHSTLQTEMITNTAFEPAMICSLNLDYKFTERVRAFAGGDYVNIFESDGRVNLISANAGISLMFY
jgi:hypothetical protein